ncbi:MAG: hypothetical protein KJZ54_15680 [Phycisphaerales bacterium]|nr:hypothetical protein [Phycisphaerales bacterium]MCZ7579189.1 hypothetical protein [Dehalococcoidia bacterium]
MQTNPAERSQPHGAAAAANDRTVPEVYGKLAEHQLSEHWYGRNLISTLQEWASRFIVEFELDIREVALCVDNLPVSSFGHFRRGHNGFGLKGEIALNARHVSGAAEQWKILGVLLKHLLHAWQDAHGTPAGRGHHNREFREKAASLGLLVDEKGMLGFAAAGPFKDLLRRHGIAAPREESPIPTRRPRGESKQKKWSCGCTNVRCAVADLHAQCLKCAQVFKRTD